MCEQGLAWHMATSSGVSVMVTMFAMAGRGEDESTELEKGLHGEQWEWACVPKGCGARFREACGNKSHRLVSTS